MSDKIIWHLFPKELPKKEGEYLVTLTTGDEEPFVSTRKYTFLKLWNGVRGHEVIAWAERPTAYKPSVDWHPFPQEEPKKVGDYYVTLKDQSVVIKKFDFDAFGPNDKFGLFSGWVIAWAEIDYPDPYRQIKKKSRRKREQL